MRHVERKKGFCRDQDWSNKSLRRSNIVVYVYDEHENETVEMEWMQYWTGVGIEES